MFEARADSVLSAVAFLAIGTLLAGCAGGSAGNAGPAAKSLPYGQTCRSVQSELRRMDARGVPAKVEAASAGKKLSSKSRADVARYNKLLNDYLGARCHT